MTIEAQNGDYDLKTSAATIYNKQAAADGEYYLDIRVGDGTKNLHTDAATLTLTVTVGGATVGGGSVTVTKAAGVLRAILPSTHLFVASGDSIVATLASNNVEDDDVDVTVTPRIVQANAKQISDSEAAADTVELRIGNLDASVYTAASYAETAASAAVSAAGSSASAAGYSAANAAALLAIKGAGWSTETLKAIKDAIPAAAPTAVAVRQEMDANSTKLANVDVAVSSRLASAGYTTPPTVVAIRQEIDTNSTKLADLYHADVFLTRDNSNGQDEWTVQWYKNGIPVTTGVTSATIQVVRRSDGGNLIVQSAMTEIGSTGAFRYDSTTRLTLGEAAITLVQATIDGSARTWRRPVGRDG